MALWGNKAAVESGGTVTVDYTTLEVLGSGTTFGSAGFAKTGQTIELELVQEPGWYCSHCWYCQHD